MKTFLVLAAAVFGLSLASGPMSNSHGGEQKTKAEEQKVKKLFESMRNGKYADRITFPRLDHTDIPALLEYADGIKTLKSFPRNPFSSQFESECSEGMVALWLIEGVRKGGQYPSLNALCLQRGVKNEDWAKASEANHKQVATAYRAWWEKAKGLSAEKAKELDPLAGTDLYWR